MKKYIFTTIILIFSFLFLLLLTFLIDDIKIRNNVSSSLTNYNFLNNKKYNLDIDNYTDMIILNVITYNKSAPIMHRALGNEYGFLYIDRYDEKEIYWNQYENLNASLNGTNDASIFYGRYWHGSQIFIKPLLYFFTYQNTLVFLTVIGIVLILYSCFLVFKKLSLPFALVYILSLLSLNIYVFNSCYQYFFSMIPMIIFNIIILINYGKDQFNINLCFYIFGAITSYIMYISFPLITLCYPLLLAISLDFKAGKYYDYKGNIKKIFKLSLNWVIAYVFFYLIKWILGTIFVGSNFVEDAFLSISQRLGTIFSFDYLDVLKLNVTYFFNNKINIILFIVSIFLIILKMGNNFRDKIKIISPLLLVFLMPFAWMFICNNHSGVHYWMISRIFSISIFSLLIILLFLHYDIKYKQLEKIDYNDILILTVLLLFIALYKLNLIFICICSLIIFIFRKINKNVKIFIGILIFMSTFLFISKQLNKNSFSDKDFFVNTYNELYHKAIQYGNEYVNKNNISDMERIDIRQLIETVNSDSVFLLSCKGYITVKNAEVKPYINCGDLIVTDGYADN